MAKSNDTSDNETWMLSNRSMVLAQLLLENEATLAAAMGLPPTEMSAEKLQDAAIHAIKGVVNSLDHIQIVELPQDED